MEVKLHFGEPKAMVRKSRWRCPIIAAISNMSERKIDEGATTVGGPQRSNPF